MNPITLLTQVLIGLAIAGATEVAVHYSFSTTLLYLNFWALAFAVITPLLVLAVAYLHSASEQINTDGASIVQYQLYERLQNCYDHGLVAFTLPLSCLLLTFRVAPISPSLSHALLGVLGCSLVFLGVGCFFLFRGKMGRFTNTSWFLTPLMPIACLALALAFPGASHSMLLFSLVGLALGISTEAVILMLVDLVSLADLTASASRTNYAHGDESENLA